MVRHDRGKGAVQGRHWLRRQPITAGRDPDARLRPPPDMRVKDPAALLVSCTEVMRMRVPRKLDFRDMKFSPCSPAHLRGNEDGPEVAGNPTAWAFLQCGELELADNVGTEIDADFGDHDADVHPRGFSHLCVPVPDLDSAATWLGPRAAADVKRSDQSKRKDGAFVNGPDGHWNETIEPAPPRTFPSIMWTVSPALRKATIAAAMGSRKCIDRTRGSSCASTPTPRNYRPWRARMSYGADCNSPAACCLTGRNRHQAPAPRSRTTEMSRFWT